MALCGQTQFVYCYEKTEQRSAASLRNLFIRITFSKKKDKLGAVWRSENCVMVYYYLDRMSEKLGAIVSWNMLLLPHLQAFLCVRVPKRGAWWFPSRTQTNEEQLTEDEVDLCH